MKERKGLPGGEACRASNAATLKSETSEPTPFEN
jgi:hypothetical protein